jgi:ferredoxin
MDVVRNLVPDFATRPVYICGPDAMATDTRALLQTAGVPANRITLESFTPAAAVAKDAGATPGQEMSETATAVVTFTRSNKSANLAPGKTILETAESIGVPIDYQCREGICGTCRCKLLSGNVTMASRDALTDGDIADGYILACQSTATEDVTIDA